MKNITILGPFPNTVETAGGVAEYDFGLAKELAGREGINLSVITNHGTNSKGIEVFETKKKGTSLQNLMMARKELQRNLPDVIITSLQYSFCTIGLKNVKRVHIYHGFEGAKFYPLWKRLIFKILNRFVSKHFEYCVANSHFTKMINESIYGNRVDAVVKPGVSNDFLAGDDTMSQKDIDYLFVGRLHPAKNVLNIIQAFEYGCSDEGLTIVGDGPDFDKLKLYSRNHGLNVTFVGNIENGEVINYYKRAKVFISLNDHEPFGITTVEAISQNCVVVSPNVGGQAETLINFYDRAVFVKDNDSKNVGRALLLATEKFKLLKDINVERLHEYSYKHIADKLLCLILDK